MVYHLKYQPAGHGAAAPIYRHYRIVMTRDGIRRIDDMSAEA